MMTACVLVWEILGAIAPKSGLVRLNFFQYRWLQLGCGQAFLRASHTVSAKAVVGVHNADACDSHGMQVSDGLFSFTLVGRPHVENVFLDRLVQHHGASGRPDQWYAVFFKMRKDGLAVRRAAGEEQRHHILFFDQLARVLARQFGIEVVVERDQFNLLSVDAAFCIDGVNVQLGAIGGLLHASANGTGKACGLTHQDLRQADLTQRDQHCGHTPSVQHFHVYSL